MSVRATRRIGQAIAGALDQATYRGYVAGFEAARDQAAAILRVAGQPQLARTVASLAPRSEREMHEADLD
jgi:hypothetical protein